MFSLLFYPEGGGSKFLRNVGSKLSDDSITPQKTEMFIVTAVTTSDLLYCEVFSQCSSINLFTYSAQNLLPTATICFSDCHALFLLLVLPLCWNTKTGSIGHNKSGKN
jgi:hypothetical protein